MKIWGTRSVPSPVTVMGRVSRQCGLLDASWSRAEVFNLLRVRDCFEIPVQATDFFQKKLNPWVKFCNNFKSFWISLRPTRGSGAWRVNPLPSSSAPPSWHCLGHVCRICVALTLVNQGEGTLWVPSVAISFTCAKCWLVFVSGPQGTGEVRKKIHMQIRGELNGERWGRWLVYLWKWCLGETWTNVNGQEMMVFQ